MVEITHHTNLLVFVHRFTSDSLLLGQVLCLLFAAVPELNATYLGSRN
jgi:hypothetical protein